MNFQWYDWVRMVTALLAVTAFTLSMLTMRRHWDWVSHNTRYKSVWWSSNAFLVLLTEESIEEALKNVHREPQMILGFLVAVASVYAQLRPEFKHKREKDMPRS